MAENDNPMHSAAAADPAVIPESSVTAENNEKAGNAGNVEKNGKTGKTGKTGDSAMIRVATFIVDKRNLIFLLAVIMLIFSLISSSWVNVEQELTAFLPADSETRRGLDVMEEQFITYGTAQVMVDSITFSEAEELHEALSALSGIQSIDFDETEDHYHNASALFSITFDWDEDDSRCLDALESVKSALASYDVYVSTDLGNQTAEIIDAEIQKIMVLVAIIVVAVLLFTSQTFAEVPVLLITFVMAMLLNKGSNFVFGTISFVSDSVTSILQLALSLDYAVIFSNRFREEHQALPIREAVIVALSKAIPEISASSLTTIGGLFAMLFMQFEIGPDMGICLIKAIVYALLSTFLLMPGLLVLFGRWMDKTVHRSLIPRIPFVGKFAWATRHVVPILFLLIMLIGFRLSQDCPYVYGYDTLVTPVLNETQIADQMIEENFGSDNLVALVIPAGDTAKEAALISQLESRSEVESCTGLANIEAMDGYTLTDRLTPRQFSELADLDYEVAELLYTAYAVDHEDYGKIVGGLTTYSIPLMDIFEFAYQEIQDGYVTLEDEQLDDLTTAYDSIQMGRAQLEGTDYDRILVYLTLPEGGDETYAFLDTMREKAQEYYPDDNVYVVGNSTNEYDFKKSFQRDNIVVTVLSILIVLAVLLFTFRSVGMPILLIAVIEGAIWLNFSIPTLTGSGVFFMGYLVVSSIQMGANIDYAIVISSRFTELKDQMPKKDAIIETMNFAFPTILTSGSILAAAGILIGQMTSEPTICGIGQALGRGTIISIILVMFVLPQILLLGERIIDRSSFSVPSRAVRTSASGRVVLNGLVRGEIHGTIVGTVNAIVEGDVNVNVLTGSAEQEQEAPGSDTDGLPDPTPRSNEEEAQHHEA